MSTSVFTYNLTRPYPYRWYTPVVVVGFVVAAVLFSFLNLVSSGYTLQARYLFDSDATTWSDSDSWLKHWPSAFVGSIKPTCQPSAISVGTTTVTDNGALSWTITNVTLHSGSGGTVKPLSSLVYQSNYLENCQFRSVTLYLDTYLGGRNAPQISWSTWGVEVEGRVYCEVYNSNPGITYVNLTAGYSLLPRAAFENNDTFHFPGRDPSLYSLWWGESLLSAAYWDLVNAMGIDDYGIVSGVICLESNDSLGTSEPNLQPRDLYLPAPRAGNESVSIQPVVQSPFASDDFVAAPSLTKRTTVHVVAESLATSEPTAISELPNPGIKPFVERRAQTLGSIFLSVMWTDLGQIHRSYNILRDPELLRNFSQELTAVSNLRKENQMIGPRTSAYSPNSVDDARLLVHPSVLITEYLCQVPQRQPWGSLITSILVADLVFLRTLWAIVTFVASYFAKKHSLLANSCETCLRPFDYQGSETERREEAKEIPEAEMTIVGDDWQSLRNSLLVRTASHASLRPDADLEHVSEQRL